MTSLGNGSRNQLLAVLPDADRDLLRPHLEFVGLDVHQVLEEPGDLTSHLYFIESGLVSIVGIAKPNHRIEVGMIGYEGVTGFGVVLGNDRSPNELLVQSAGSALRISTPALRKIMASSQSFTSTLLNYVHTFMVQGSQTALANGRGRLDQRLARWLLMWHDRIQSDEFPTTHEFLALLLGVRRAGVTVALHELEGRGLIRSLRGRVRIVDRPGLQLAASGRTSIAADPNIDLALYATAGYRVCGARAVRVDILERLADLIRPALAWRDGASGTRPPGAVRGGGFAVVNAMTSLTGASGEDFASILRSLGYRMERRLKLADPPIAQAPAVQTSAEEASADHRRSDCSEPAPTILSFSFEISQPSPLRARSTSQTPTPVTMLPSFLMCQALM